MRRKAYGQSDVLPALSIEKCSQNGTFHEVACEAG
jgi:hypothetical protein